MERKKIGKIGAGALFDSRECRGAWRAFAGIRAAATAKLPEARTGPSHRAVQLAQCSL